ncbi:Pentatricopeptide repeat-containing protein, mitochondrial [Vitis vinifera]|uniref:Pentatricopeptide repeat-containing protein, mitochondrial n=1 Tax=Vitis vinifera TaxID=29760 RepID=A0A438CYB2_VITVI|nr:Pentatricopeptide repeat-containing protein, mitochondrial [Vitis vinifera]
MPSSSTTRWCSTVHPTTTLPSPMPSLLPPHFMHSTRHLKFMHRFQINLLSRCGSWTSIISGLSKCGFDEEAIGEFLSMDVKPNTSTLEGCDFLDYNGGGLAQGGLCEEAVEVFQAMVKGGEAVPNEVTLVNVLTACSSLSALNLGRWVHSYISIRYDLVVDGNVGNALINMYAKCSDMYMAVRVFNELTHKDMISWSTIIGGMAMNGHGMHALQFFSLMLVHGVSPDDVTFIGLLSACSHAGLVEQGLIFFKAMNDVYGIAPQMQHYACMVDMYGRAGLLEEAEALLEECPWKLRAPFGEHYSMLARFMGMKRCLGRSTKAFVMLKEDMGLKKMSGCSWIEVDAMINRYDGANRSFAFAGNGRPFCTKRVEGAAEVFSGDDSRKR